MSKMAHIIEGEASESDSEIELGKSPDSIISQNKGRAFVVLGEAPESDDDSKLQSPNDSNNLDVPLQSSVSPVPPSPTKLVHNSLLHQKLWECNVKLRATLEGLVKHTTDISVEKLTSADKTLLNVQESIRATNANLTLSRARLKQLHEALERANCSSVLTTVRITP